MVMVCSCSDDLCVYVIFHLFALVRYAGSPAPQTACFYPPLPSDTYFGDPLSPLYSIHLTFQRIAWHIIGYTSRFQLLAVLLNCLAKSPIHINMLSVFML